MVFNRFHWLGLDDDRDSFIRAELSLVSFPHLCAESATYIIAQGNALGCRDEGTFALKGQNNTSIGFLACPFRAANHF
jgi:hypothetical protein